MRAVASNLMTLDCGFKRPDCFRGYYYDFNQGSKHSFKLDVVTQLTSMCVRNLYFLNNAIFISGDLCDIYSIRGCIDRRYDPQHGPGRPAPERRGRAH